MTITVDMPVPQVWRMVLDDPALAATPEFVAWVQANGHLLDPTTEEAHEQWQKWREEAYAGRPEDTATRKHRQRHGGKLA